MNVNDIKESTIPIPTQGKDRLDLIFERQWQLIEKYHEIEEANGLLQTSDIPINIDDRFGQARLKDFAWRLTEELAEATNAKEIHPDIPNHFLEEIADAYHFLIELTILIGWDAETLHKSIVGALFVGVSPSCKLKHLFLQTNFRTKNIWAIIENLGLAMNCLKQKPWKQSHVLTDKDRFYAFFVGVHIEFLNFIQGEGIDYEDLFKIYFKKSEVNKFRQETRY